MFFDCSTLNQLFYFSSILIPRYQILSIHCLILFKVLLLKLFNLRILLKTIEAPDGLTQFCAVMGAAIVSVITGFMLGAEAAGDAIGKFTVWSGTIDCRMPLCTHNSAATQLIHIPLIFFYSLLTDIGFIPPQ